MDEITLLLKFLKKANKELASSTSTEKIIVAKIIASLIGKDTDAQRKQLVALSKNKWPLQYLLDLYAPHQSECVSQATAVLTSSYAVLKPHVCPFFYDINDNYGLYLDGNPIEMGKEHCYGCIYDKQTDKTIYDFDCSYECYQSGHYINDLAIAVFILNYYLKENWYES